MTYIIVGLGNPDGDDKEYEGTRHNTGRDMLFAVVKAFGIEEFKNDKKLNAKTGQGKIGKEKIILIAPDTYMNKSGNAVGKVVKSIKAAEKLIVIYDDFNLPLGMLRISFNRSSGGHNGLESVIKAVKTEAFLRIRVGVSPATTKGVAKVPHGEDKIEKFILGKFKPDELKELKKVEKRIIEAVELLIKEGKDKAMSAVNGR